MEKSFLIRSLLACIAASIAVVVPSASVVRADTIENKLNTILNPIEYHILGIDKSKTGDLEINLAFNVTKEWKDSSKGSNKVSLVLLPPLRLSLVSAKKEFVKVETKWEELVGKDYSEPGMKAYKDFGKAMSKVKCSKDSIIKLISEDFPAEDKDIFAFRSYDSDAKNNKEVINKIPFIKLVTLVKDVDSIKEGVYTWTGIFKNISEKLLEAGSENLFTDDWSLALISTSTTPVKVEERWCIGNSNLSAQLLFRSLPWNANILMCMGHLYSPAHNKKLVKEYHFLPLNATIEWESEADNESYVNINLETRPGLGNKFISPDSVYLSIYLPKPEGVIPKDFLKVSDFENAYVWTEAGRNEKCKVESYNKDENIVVLKFSKVDSDIFSKPFSVKLDCTKLMKKAPVSGSWRVVAEAAFAPKVVRAYNRLYQALKNVEVTKFSRTIRKNDADHKACMEIYIEPHDALEIHRSNFDRSLIAASEPTEIAVVKVEPKITATLNSYGPSKFMLMLTVKARRGDNWKVNSIAVHFPKADITYNGNYYEEESVSHYHVLYGYSYNEESKKLEIDFKVPAEADTKKPYVIPVPFISSNSIDELMDLKLWKFELLGNSSKVIKSDAELIALPSTKVETDLVATSGSLAAKVVSYAAITTADSEGIFVTIDSPVTKDMIFTFNFSNNVLNMGQCAASVRSNVVEASSKCCTSKFGSTLLRYHVHTGRNSTGTMERFTFHIMLTSAFAGAKSSGNLDLLVEGMKDANKNDVPFNNCDQYFDSLNGTRIKLLEKKMPYKEAVDPNAVNKPKNSTCVSKASRVMSIPFNDNTHAVYYMLGIHDCAEPWFPGDIDATSNDFSLNAANKTPKKNGSSTVNDMLRYGNEFPLSKNVLEMSMKTKRFMEHTLYVFFDNEVIKTLREHLIRAKLCTDEDAACKDKGELKGIELFVDDYIKKDERNLFGDVVLTYYDKSAKTIVLKRKPLYPEDKAIKNEIKSIFEVDSVKTAMEKVLDHGLAHIDVKSMNDALSLIAFVSTDHEKELKGKLKKYVKPSNPSNNDGKVLKPLFIAVHGIEKLEIKDGGSACRRILHFTAPIIKSSALPGIKLSDVKRYLSKDVLEYDIYDGFSFPKPAEEIVDSKDPSMKNVALKGKETKRKPERNDFAYYFGFDHIRKIICLPKNATYNLEFTDITRKFASYVTESVIETKVMFAACVKFDDKEGYEAKDTKYTLSNNGHYFASASVTKEEIGSKVDDRCNLMNLYKYMPHTSHFDETFDYDKEMVSVE